MKSGKEIIKNYKSERSVWFRELSDIIRGCDLDYKYFNFIRVQLGESAAIKFKFYVDVLFTCSFWKRRKIKSKIQVKVLRWLPNDYHCSIQYWKHNEGVLVSSYDK